MKFMIIIKSSSATEAGVTPGNGDRDAMWNYNQELSDAGILIGGEGLYPSSKGVRLSFDEKEVTVTKGPFSATKELIAGYWIWELPSLEDAVAWVKRYPGGERFEVEIRQVLGTEESGETFAQDFRDEDARVRQQQSRTQLTSAATRALINIVNDAWISADIDVILEHVTDDVEWTMVARETLEGKEALQEFLETRTPMDSNEYKSPRIVVDGATAIATGQGSFQSPDTREPKSFSYCDIYTLRGNKIAAIESFVLDLPDQE